MRWFTKHLWHVGIACVGMLFLLTCLALIPLSTASAHEGTLGVATPTAATVQATPTEDATVTVLNKEKLQQEVQQLKEQNDMTVMASNKEKLQHENDWWWNYGATILTSIITTLTLAAAGIFTVVRYFNDRKDMREQKETEAKRLIEDSRDRKSVV